MALTNWDTRSPLSDTESQAISSLASFFEEENTYTTKLDPLSISEPLCHTDIKSDVIEKQLQTPRYEQLPASHEAIKYYQQLQSYCSILNSALSGVDNTQRTLQQLDHHYMGVWEKTTGVRHECESLLKQQQTLIEQADRLRTDLAYFDEADVIASRLKNGLRLSGTDDLKGETTDISSEFASLIHSLERSLTYMNQHSELSEAQRYRVIFTRLRSKLLRTIKTHFSDAITLASKHVLERKPLPTKKGDSIPDLESELGSASVDPMLSSLSTLSMKVFVELRSVAASIRPLLLDLAKRSRGDSKDKKAWRRTTGSSPRKQQISDDEKEYMELMNDILQIYQTNRHSVLYLSLIEHMTKLKSANLPQRTRSACNHLIEIFVLEEQLFREFFGDSTSTASSISSPSSSLTPFSSTVPTSASSPATLSSHVLNELLGGLGNVLYTTLRPAVIQEMDLDQLCEVVTVLKYEMIQDQIQARGESLWVLNSVLRRLLADLQERLAYRAQVYLRDQIAAYQSLRPDLDYPAKLHPDYVYVPAPPSIPPSPSINPSRQLTSPTSSFPSNDSSTSSRPPSRVQSPINTPLATPMSTPRKEDREIAGQFVVSSTTSTQGSKRATMFSTWHPILERTLVFLAKLFRCLEVQVFSTLAQDAVSVCTAQLMECSRLVSKKSNTGPFDGLLFLIKHLLILREQISPFQVDFSVTRKTLDFSHIRDVVPRLISGKWTSFMRLLRLVEESAPRVMENTTDSKKHMEDELKKACENLIAVQTQYLIGPLLSFFNKLGKTDGKQSTDVSSTSSDMDELLSILKQLVAKEKDGSEGKYPVPESDEQQKNQTVFEARLKKVIAANALYLGNKLTEKILFKPVKRTLSEVLEQLRFYVDQNVPKTISTQTQTNEEEQEVTSITIGESSITTNTNENSMRNEMDLAITSLETLLFAISE